MTISPEPDAVPALDPAPPLAEPALPTTGLAHLDRAVAQLVSQFAGHLNEAVDEVYTALAHAYPGLYADPDAPTETTVEYRVTETNGHKRLMPPAAAVAAHRLGLTVERRTVRFTSWEVEPNPNTAYRMAVSPPPRMRESTPERDAVETAAAARLVPAGYTAGLVGAPLRAVPDPEAEGAAEHDVEEDELPPYADTDADSATVAARLGSKVEAEHAAAVIALTGITPEQYDECTYDDRGDLVDGDGELILTLAGHTVSRW